MAGYTQDFYLPADSPIRHVVLACITQMKIALTVCTSHCVCAVQFDPEGGDVAQGAGRAANYRCAHVPAVQAACSQ